MLNEWARRHGISHAAIADLMAMVGLDGHQSTGGTSEAGVQAQQRLIATQRGERVWRNNVGAGKLEDGSYIRFGLANDSTAVNSRIKSGDLIGIRPVLIGPGDVGRTIGQFVSYECKRPGWRYKATDREVAQLRWAMLILTFGGHAEIVS